MDHEKRHHLLHCYRYDGSRPEKESLYDDKSLDGWKSGVLETSF